MELLSPGFAKLYYYSSRLWKGNDLMRPDMPEKKDYYGIFFNKLAINETRYQIAYNFPKCFVSSYRNGLLSHLIQIFEYLGEEILEEKWNKKTCIKL